MSNALQSQTQSRPYIRPALDVFEKAEHFLIVADVPGVGADQVSLNLEDGELTLVAERARSPEDVKPLHGQFADYDYRVTLRVPPDVDGEQVQARIDAGVLEVTLPKAATAKARQIQVTAG